MEAVLAKAFLGLTILRENLQKINYQQEKEKINDEKESTDVNYKKKSNNKHKSGNDGESNNNWQVYEVDILLQYIADNFDEYTKDHNEKFGVERKYWDCYEKMDAIFGTHENIAPSFIANRSTDIDGEESSGMKPKTPKR
ncbi:hypothetical protein RhiirA4_476984 [Rhizophagus irregularis]|uniref:Uncharacterized protein n=1 Tax=Rhizophagus irregularis TaxID=588596 RepID=A0A2I1HCH8_9GLOM|nr:hypothetical protein RhiirA4_476984 [Rhizophagus irregularis]